MSNTSYYFLPWVRYGLLKHDQGMPILGDNAFQNGTAFPGRTKIHVELKLNDQLIDMQNLSFFGPGDIVGIDAREIVRTEPKHLVPDFPPQLFPFIEFDRPDFPWLFTPGKPDAGDRLLPWIVLVVLRKDDGKIITDVAKPSPELECDIKELPDLNESWAWAHAQYIGASDTSQENISEELATKPLQNVSRLICPRKLKPNEHYLACVVPTFKVTESKDQTGNVTSTLDLAWRHGSQSPTTRSSSPMLVPIYYHWKFSTAAEGNFKDFIARLKMPGDLNSKVQEAFFRCMDVSSLFKDKPAQAATLDIISVLELEAIDKPTATDQQQKDVIQAQLTNKIDGPQSLSDKIPPPAYGSWHVQKHKPGIPSLNDARLPAWYKTLNLDPRYRVAAALGTQVIQQQQEQLMVSAWEQASGWDAANRLIRQKQCAEKVTYSIYKRIKNLSDATFMQITEPIAEAVEQHLSTTKENVTISRNAGIRTAAISDKNYQDRILVSANCRRFLRSHGHLFRRGLTPGDEQPKARKPSSFQAAMASNNTGTITPVAMENSPEQVASASVSPVAAENAVLQVAPVVISPEILSQVTITASTVKPPVITTNPVPQVTEVTMFPWIIASYHPVYFHQALPQPQQVLIAEIKKNRLEGIRPDLTFAEDLQDRLEISPKNSSNLYQFKIGKTREASSSNMMKSIKRVDVSFPQPMYEPLRDFFREMLIPGLDQIPNNSLVVLKTNLAFIEAYMVGLNHEMSRELLWREYPAYLEQTFFKKFWDDRGSGKPATDDLAEIQNWTKDLGQNLVTSQEEELWMLLIKGDLLTRFPNTIISARKGSETRYHDLRVNLQPDVTILGFQIESPNDWTFVLQEHPTDTRFGLNNESRSKDTLRDLTWSDVALSENGSEYISLKPGLNTKLASSAQQDVSWGKNSAHMAYITLQKPYMISIPAKHWFV